MTLFSYGFRFFFLAAGLYAAAAVAAWLAWLGLHLVGGVVLTPTFAGAAHQWHGHEMIFGYAVAALAGFLLTAVPSWTGTRPLAGRPLVLLAAVWLAGRLAMWFSAFLPPLAVAVADLLFLPLLGVLLARALFVRPAPRNLIFLGLIAVLFVANLACHLEWTGSLGDGVRWGLTLAIVTLASMVAIIGGRIVPAFTRNALMRMGVEDGLPRSFAPLELVTLAAALALVVCYALPVPAPLTGAVAALAAVASLVRLAFWRADRTLGQPIVWSLHLAYLWLPVGYGAIAADMLFGLLPSAFALHALGIGAVGGMTLAVMTRAALGHSGRPLVVARPIAVAYVLVALAAVVRVGATVLATGLYLEAVLLSGALWLAAFTLFALVYWPILTKPSLSEAGRI